MRKKVNQRQLKEDRYKDGKNIPSGMTIEQEQRLLRGVFAEELRGDYRCGSFKKEFVNPWSILGSSNELFWGDDAFTPEGVPEGDVYDPTRERYTEEACDLMGFVIDDES